MMDAYQELKDAVLAYDALKDTDPFPWWDEVMAVIERCDKAEPAKEQDHIDRLKQKSNKLIRSGDVAGAVKSL